MVLGIGLVPWTLLLAFTLPDHHGTNHYNLAWTGFDIVLAGFLIATAIGTARRAAWLQSVAAVAAALLVCDAWFDVVTARTTSELVQAVVEAALVEIPLAILCFWMASNLVRAVEVARPFLRKAGFRVEGNRLVPPDDLGTS
jgi:hypothetical protein